MRLVSPVLRSFLALGVSVPVLALAVAASAQGAPAPEDEVTEVIVTGAAYGVAKEALTSNVDVLTRAQLSEKPALGLGDMLSGLPGVRSSNFAPGASRPVIRGLDGFRVLVLNNGMGSIDASAVSPDHAVATDPMEAQRIEVLRGPSALIYGGNAIGGVVNIIDDRIATTPAQNGVEGRAAAQVSSGNNGKQLGINAKIGDGPVVLTLDMLRRKSDDYRTPVGPEARYLTDLEGEEPDTSRRQVNSAVDLKNYGAGISYVGDFGFVGLAVKQTDSLYGVPGHEHGHEEDHDHEDEGPVTIGLKQTRYDVRSGIDLALGGFNRLEVDASYSDYQHTEFEGSDVGTQFVSHGYEARASLIRRRLGELSGAIGINVSERNFAARGEEAFVPSSTTKDAGIYGQFRWDRQVWGLEGGVRVDSRRLRSAGFARDFGNLSASVGTFWRPSDHAFFGLSLTRSERAPSDVELLADGPHVGTGSYEIGEATLKSEVGNSLELTGHWTADAHTAFTIDAHVFVSRFDGYIDLRPTGDEEDHLPVYRFRQTDADFHGFELEVGRDLWRQAARALRLEASYDYVRGQSDWGDVARMSPSALTGRLAYEGEKWRSHIEVRHVADADTHLATFETPTDGYRLVNLFAAYDLGRSVSLFGEICNLGDVETREHTSAQKLLVVGAGRSVRTGLVYRF